MIPQERDEQTRDLISQARLLDAQAAQELEGSAAAQAWLRSRKCGRGLDRQGRLEGALRAALQAEEDVGAAPVLLRQAGELRWLVVLLHGGVAFKIARKYTREGWDFREVLQVAQIGVYEGAKRFDPDRGLLFGTYARWWARAQVTREMAPSDLSQGAQEQLRRLRQLELRGPVPNAVAALWLRATPEWVAKLRALDQRDLRWQVSINEAIDDAGHTLADVTPDPEGAEPIGPDLELALRAVRGLPEREREVIVLRYGLAGGLTATLDGIGQRLGVSRERVRQIERRALKELREVLGAGGAS